MAKQRRTRLQKIAAEQRLSKSSSQPPKPSLSHKQTVSHVAPPTHATPHVTASQKTNVDYAFVRHDLIRTTSITGAIVLAELVLFFVMKT